PEVFIMAARLDMPPELENPRQPRVFATKMLEQMQRLLNQNVYRRQCIDAEPAKIAIDSAREQTGAAGVPGQQVQLQRAQRMSSVKICHVGQRRDTGSKLQRVSAAGMQFVAKLIDAANCLLRA